jgi:hypothetical protein
MRIVLFATAVAAAMLNLHIVRVPGLRSLYLSAPIFHGPSRGPGLDPERDSRRGINASSAHKHGSTLEECGIRRYVAVRKGNIERAGPKCMAIAEKLTRSRRCGGASSAIYTT